MVLAHDLQESKKTEDIQTNQDVIFETMLLSQNTLKGLKTSGFVTPSPIQLHGIPLGKCGFDILLEAKSGTGKTAVFTVIALEKLDLNKGLQTIVLAPTREIAAQICDVLRQIGCQYNGLRVEVVMGGLPVQDDIEKFKGNKVHIVVGSPGRLRHLISDHHMDISGVRLVVLDEADKLMEKCFLTDIKHIYLALPQEKQVIMSSATYPESCKEFIQEFVQDAQHICPNSDCVLLGVVQKVTHVKYNSNSIIQTTNKFKELLKIITSKLFKQCLIFCNYRARVGELYKHLTRAKWPAEQLYGAQDQIDRLDALKTLQEYKCRILISTDLAARGIDAHNVDLVINFEAPYEWQTYLHRIGRAGRFGSYGMAITILSEGDEQKKFMNMLSTVNLSFKLSPLWTETESNNTEKTVESESKDQIQLNGYNDHNCSELWKIICDTEISSVKEKIEDFQELYTSFQYTTNTNDVESFSDLLNSFHDNCLIDTKEIKYKCIECPNLSTQQYIDGVKNKLIDQGTKSSSQKFNNNINGCEKRIWAGKNKPTDNTQSVEYKSRENNKKTIPTCANNSYESYSKCGDAQEMKPVKTDNNKLNQTRKSYKPPKFNCYKKQISCSSSDEGSKILRHRSQPKVINTHLYEASNKKNVSKGASPSEKCNNVHHDNTYISTNRYNDWYKELKYRVRQIELAIYIDELSKL